MRIFPILALSLASAGLRADLLTQEFSISTYSVNHQGTEFSYLDTNEFFGPMKFNLTFDLSSENAVFYSNIDMDDEVSRYVSTNTQFDPVSFSYNYDSILLDEMMSYHSPSAIESSRLYFTDILFDLKPDGRIDMVENRASINVSATTVTESLITGDPNSGNYIETQKLYSTYLSFSADEYFDILDAEAPTASTLTDMTDFLAEYPVAVSFGIEGFTQSFEYHNYQVTDQNIFNFSGFWGQGEAAITGIERIPDAVSVNTPTSLMLFSISLLALGYRRFLAL